MYKHVMIKKRTTNLIALLLPIIYTFVKFRKKSKQQEKQEFNEASGHFKPSSAQTPFWWWKNTLKVQDSCHKPDYKTAFGLLIFYYI